MILDLNLDGCKIIENIARISSRSEEKRDTYVRPLRGEPTYELGFKNDSNPFKTFGTNLNYVWNDLNYLNGLNSSEVQTHRLRLSDLTPEAIGRV